MFNKNLEALKHGDNNLAEKLEKKSLSEISSINALEASSGDFIISYKDIPLNSAENPVLEAKELWNGTIQSPLRKNDIVIIFGLGLGYLFKRAFVSTNAKIFVYEPFEDVLRFTLEYVDFSKELSENRVFISNDIREIFQKLEDEYLSGDKIEFLYSNAYVLSAKDDLLQLTQKTLQICESKSMDSNTVFNRCKNWTTNFILNVSEFNQARPVGYFEEKFKNKPALIISAGPSLSENLEKIRKSRGKFITIAVGAALKVLLNADIVPDFVCFADDQYLKFQVKGIEDKLNKITLVASSRADSDIFKEDFNNKLIYFSKTDSLADYYKKLTDENIGLYESGSTVSVQSYCFAKALGCNPIAFTGLDLAFIDEKTYADGSPIVKDESGNLNIGPLVKKPAVVESANGGFVATRDDYALFIRHFEEIFSKDVLVRIINTSNKGALINGMEYMEFDNFVNLLENERIEINQPLFEIYSETQSRWEKINEHIFLAFAKQKEEIFSLDLPARKAYFFIEEICKQAETKETDLKELESQMKQVCEIMTDIRNFVINNPFMSNYLQNELFKYSGAYNTSIVLSEEEIIHNIKLDRDFVRMVVWTCDNLLSAFDEFEKKCSHRLQATSP